MIRSRKQYWYCRRQLSRLTAMKRRMNDMIRSFSIDPVSDKRLISEIDCAMADLSNDLQEFEQLEGGLISLTSELRDLTLLPITLIKSRIALGWSQRDLAERVGMKRHQITRYETSMYKDIGLYRAIEIARVLQQALMTRNSGTILRNGTTFEPPTVPTDATVL